MIQSEPDSSISKGKWVTYIKLVLVPCLLPGGTKADHFIYKFMGSKARADNFAPAPFASTFLIGGLGFQAGRLSCYLSFLYRQHS
jgi:hypothetical protein